MAFNLDHTASGNLNLAGSYAAFTGSFTFPKPASNGSVVTFLTQGAADITSISGLQSCIDSLVDTNEVGTASTLDADNTADNAVLINNSNLIDISVLPNSIDSSIFVVSNSGQLVLLNQAKKGSVATTANPYQSYVLGDGLFNNISNWIPLLNPDNCVDSVNSKTGEFHISGIDLASSAGLGSNVNSAIELLATGYVSCSCLTNEYKTESSFNTEVSSYETTSSLTNTLLSYVTEQCVSNCLANYTDNNGTGALFAPYALSCTFGTASESQHNVGTAGSCILCVGVSGCVDSSVLPDISLIETFIISAQDNLTGLSSATIGDVAFNTESKINYILAISGENAYQTLSNWCEFSAEEGSLLNVNNHSADPNGIVTIYSNDICLPDSSTSVSNCIFSIDNKISGANDYASSGAFVSDRENYTTTSSFDSIAATKSTTGHSHVISDIIDLDSCLADISAFKEANKINLLKSYSYKLSDSSFTNSSGTLILGDKGKGENNYSIIQSAGRFSENGDAQFSSIVGKVYPTNDNWTDIINIDMDPYSIALFNAEFVSRNDDAFRLEGAVIREGVAVSIPEEPAKTIYHTGAIAGDVRIHSSNSSFSLQVKGQSYWMSNLEMLYAKPTGVQTVGLYWSNIVDSDWYNVGANWFTDNTLETQATSLPSGSSDVYMSGSAAAFVDLDNQNWVQPNSINTVLITDPLGILFTSQNNGIFSGTVYGNASLSGNASFQ
jgi:hypothetical protein